MHMAKDFFTVRGCVFTMEKDIAASYDASAPYYDARYRSIQRDKYRFALSLTGPICGQVLDVGCGTGLLAEYLGSDINGIDISSGMLRRAARRMNVREADATDIPFPNDYFDWVFSFTVLQNISDYHAALREIGRVLHPRGRCLLTYLNKPMFDEIGESIEHIFKVEQRHAHGEDVIFLCSHNKGPSQ